MANDNDLLYPESLYSKMYPLPSHYQRYLVVPCYPTPFYSSGGNSSTGCWPWELSRCNDNSTPPYNIVIVVLIYVKEGFMIKHEKIKFKKYRRLTIKFFPGVRKTLHKIWQSESVYTFIHFKTYRFSLSSLKWWIITSNMKENYISVHFNF